MSIIQAVIGSIVSSGSATPTPTYTLGTDGVVSMNEGSTLGVVVGGTNIPDGTYYWTIETNAGDFATASGTVSVSGNSGSFLVTPTEDATTEGAETFTVALREGSITGTILATSVAVTINDTSQTPVPPFSLEFNQPQSDYLSTPAGSDWNLGTTGTIEFWLNANNASDANIHIPGGQWGLINQGGWYYGMPNNSSILIGLAGGRLSIAQSNTDDVQYVEPTAGGWTHVAVVYDSGTQKVFYNGVEQTKVSGNYLGNGWTNSTSDLYIGRLAPSYQSHFDGKMALVRISTTAKYATAFTPITTYGVEADTRLFLGTNTPLVDLAIYELNGVELTTSNGGNLYIPKSTYPDLNNQVKAGDTVVNANNLTSSSVVSGAVYTADPNNWGVPISPSMTLVTNVNFSGPGRHSITNNGVALSNDVPATFAPQSLQIVQAQTDYLDVAASGDWNLGTTWTIEFWSKATKASTAGDLLAVMCQNFDVGGSIDLLYVNGQLRVANGADVSSEPTPNTWTHVALVSDGANLKVYYNGSSVYTGTVYTLNNVTDPIRIGARGPGDFQRFDGQLALIRISNTDKYTGTFTPSNNYGVEADTKLFLGEKVPLIDAKGHIITNHGVTTSTGYPPMSYTLSAVAYDFTHGYDTNYGGNSIWVLIADYPDIVTVPDGATIVVSGAHSGTYTSGGIGTVSGKRRLATLIPGTVWGGDTLTITWTA